MLKRRVGIRKNQVFVCIPVCVAYGSLDMLKDRLEWDRGALGLISFAEKMALFHF